MTYDPLAADFRNFLFLIWKHLQLPDPTPVQYDIAKHLMSTTSRLAIQAFRGVGKSWVTAAYVLWELYRNPQVKIMVVSASKNRADNFTTFCLRLIEEVPELRHLRPKANQRASKVEFDVGPALVDQTPSVFSRGIDSQLTGGRADIIVSDDVEVPSNSMTVDMRDKLLDKIKEYSAILKPYDAARHTYFVPRIIYLGTPQTEDSIYTKLPETFTTVVWPALVPTKSERGGYGDRLAPMIQEMYEKGLHGLPTDPQRFTEEDLLERKIDYGAAGFQLQFMLNTKLSDEERFPLKMKNLVIAEVPLVRAPMQVHWLPHPDRRLKDLPNLAMSGDGFYAAAGFSDTYADYQGKVLAIDPSGRGADETGFAVGFQLNGNIWVPEAGGLPGGYDEETLVALAKLAAKYKVNEVVYEGNFGDGMWGKLFEPILHKHHRCALVETTSRGMKEARMVDVLEPVVAQHKLIMAPSVIEKDYETTQQYEGEMRRAKSLVFQMTRLTKTKNALRKDDRVDALSILVGHYTDILNQDAQAKADDERRKQLQEALAQHMGAALGALRKGKKWARA